MDPIPLATGTITPTVSRRFPKTSRLLNADAYSAVFNDAPLRASHPSLLILARPNSLPHPRLGLVIAKKNVRLATERNRLKRVMRETFRLQQANCPGIDMILLARRGLGDFDNAALRRLLHKQLQRVLKKYDRARDASTR